jgi:hypothetical protein
LTLVDSGKQRFLRTFIWICTAIFILAEVVPAQVGMQLQPPPRTVRLFIPEEPGLVSYKRDSTLFAKEPPGYMRLVTLDSTGKFISVTEHLDDTEFYLPAVVDLETYVRWRLAFDQQESFRREALMNLASKREVSSGAIELEIPIRIRSKAFTRIFGGDQVKLRVSGNISFDLSGRAEKRSGAAINSVQDRANFSPRFKQTQQFTIEGKIGEKVTVSVEQNSEATFDFENTLKIRYDGDEDEVVQSIEAGNIGLSLPSTRYVIFGGSNQGLFGLKSSMKVGDFYFTTIASLEKGEQKKLTVEGGSQEQEQKLSDYQILINQYFFADNFYRDYFQFGFNPELTVHGVPENLIIKDLEVYKSVISSDGDAIPGIAVIDPREWADEEVSRGQLGEQRFDPIAGERENAIFKRLEEGVDYEFSYSGFFWLKQPITEAEILAIAYRNDEETIGTLTSTAGAAINDSSALVLRLIKPQSMKVDNPTWTLMMRNVYYLGGSDIQKEGFSLEIVQNRNGENQTLDLFKGNKSFLNLMGLDIKDKSGILKEGGDKLIDDTYPYLNFNEGILIMPALKPFDPYTFEEINGKLDAPPGFAWENVGGPNVKPQTFLISDTNRVRFYDEKDRTKHTQMTKFEIRITSRSTRTTFDLGWNVLPGSEEVLLNGKAMRKDIDYSIDYLTGELILLSQEAKRSSSSLEIKYERASIFQLDKKTILGGRAEYRFWDDSFIGLTALYMSKTTMEQRVRVGQEPFSNLVWDLNTSLKFQPRFITKMMDALPLVETSEPSAVQLEAEFAQVLPNPNTQDYDETGDNDGVAYIDDFEGSKRMTTLGIRYSTWTHASAPRKFLNYDDFGGVRDSVIKADTTSDKYRGNLIWYNPYNQVHINDIWPEKDVNTQTGQTTDVLVLEASRKPGQDPDSAWVGIMRSTASFSNQQRTKYVEIWINGNEENSPRINIDIGRISEDWFMKAFDEQTGEIYYGNSAYGGKKLRGYKQLDTEDANNNGLIEEGEDTGLDGIPDSREPEGWPDDNWARPTETAGGSRDYSHINGTEGSAQMQSANYPDSEDLDNNGRADRIDQYFEYSFSLNPNDESEKWREGRPKSKKTGEFTGWKQFRIPINEFITKFGDPDTTFQDIYYVRLWLSNLSEETQRIYIATFDFVGNEWEEVGVAQFATDTIPLYQKEDLFEKNDKKFKLAVYNTEENNDYTPPPGVKGVRDRITKAVSKEQSLVLKMEEPILPNEMALARKPLYGDVMQMVHYKKLRMFVHGDRKDFVLPNNPHPEKSELYLLLRFGSDANNYYEYVQEVYNGWESNMVEIDLDELSRTRYEAERTFKDEENKVLIYERSVPDKAGALYRAVGKPSLNTIRDFYVGVYTNYKDGFKGEILLDEMRLSDVRRESGTALRLKTSVKVADILNVNADWESKDADFHDIKTQFGEGNSSESQNYVANLKVHKFLPTWLNLAVPVDARASFSRSIPKYFPQSDVLTHYRNNTMENKFKSLFGMREVPAEIADTMSVSELYGMGTTLRTLSRSKAWYLYYTIDQLMLDFDYSIKNSRNYNTELSRSEQYRNTMTFNIPFGSNNYIEPLRFLKGVPLLKKIQDQKLYYTPQNASADINLSEVKTVSKLKRDSVATVDTNIVSSRSVKSTYKLIPSINLSYSRSHKANAGVYGMTRRELYNSIFSKGDFGLDTDMTQSAQVTFKPNLASWFTPDFTYSTNFNLTYANIDLANLQKHASSRISKQIGLGFSPSKLTSLIYQPKKKTTAQTSRSGTRPRQPVKKPADDDQENKEDGKQEEEGADKSGAKKRPQLKIPNPLMLVYNVFNSWQQIRTRLTLSNNYNNPYVAEVPDWRYQFGLTGNPGVEKGGMPDNYISYDTQGITTGLSTSTDYKLFDYILMSFKHDYNSTLTDKGINKSGSETITYFMMGGEPPTDSSSVIGSGRSLIPDWTVQIKGLEKIEFFKQFAKSISVSHGRSGKYSATTKLEEEEMVPVRQTFTIAFSPFIQISVDWIWDFSTSFRMNKGVTYDYTTNAGAKRTENNTMTITGSYSTSAGFRIPIPIWPFKGKTFKNEIDFSLTYESSNNADFQRQADQDEFQERMRTKSWELKPAANYRFNRRVTGGLFYKLGANENKISGKFSYNEFGISVNIAIRD